MTNKQGCEVARKQPWLEYHVSMHVLGLAGWCGHESRRRLMNRRQERKKLRMNKDKGQEELQGSLILYGQWRAS